MLTLLAFAMPGLPEMLILGLIGLLIFGKRLPEVGRSLGKGIVEFKKGLRSIDEDVDQASPQPPAQKPVASLPTTQVTAPQQTAPQQTAPSFRFDPYTGKPINGDTTVSVGQNSQPSQTSAPVGVSGPQEHA